MRPSDATSNVLTSRRLDSARLPITAAVSVESTSAETQPRCDTAGESDAASMRTIIRAGCRKLRCMHGAHEAGANSVGRTDGIAARAETAPKH